MGTPAATSPDEILFSGAQYRTWGDWTFNITGIPYSSYSLVFYEMSSGARGSQATALAGGPTYYASQSVASTAAGYVDNNAATATVSATGGSSTGCGMRRNARASNPTGASGITPNCWKWNASRKCPRI